MKMKTNLTHEWHYCCIHFYEMLLDGCLDEDKKVEIYLKINRHQRILAYQLHTTAT